MIFTETKKEIRVMFTPFRDGLQSVFGGKTRLGDILPAGHMRAISGIAAANPVNAIRNIWGIC